MYKLTFSNLDKIYLKNLNKYVGEERALPSNLPPTVIRNVIERKKLTLWHPQQPNIKKNLLGVYTALETKFITVLKKMQQ